MSLPEGFARAGNAIGPYPDGAFDIMEIKMNLDGKLIIGISEWMGDMCKNGNGVALALLSSLPAIVKDVVEQHLKVQ
jgi:hypothetical protein